MINPGRTTREALSEEFIRENTCEAGMMKTTVEEAERMEREEQDFPISGDYLTLTYFK